MSLTSIAANQTNTPGNTVASIILSASGDRITDVDIGAIEGIAITASVSTNGSWQYSIDNGTTWTAVGTIAETSALLLRDVDKVRFVPTAASTTSTITFRAWDQTTGVNGTKVNITATGTTTAFSVALETATILVTAANAPPVAVNDSYTTNEDTSLTIAAKGILNNDTDADANPLTSAIVAQGTLGTAVVNSDGSFAYFPNLNATGQDVFTYVANDGLVNSNVATVTITISPTNDAPVLDPSGTMTLPNINEDDTANTGSLVSAIILSAGGDRITDPDSGTALEGIAITSLQSGNGTWQYSVNNGTTWTAIGAVSQSSAILLRASDKVKFLPDTKNQTLGSFTFRAWDQTSGAFGTKVNVTSNGGTTAFSLATETATITVTPVNDAPLLDNTGNMFFTSIVSTNTTSPGNTVAEVIASASLDRITDVDIGAIEGIAVTASTVTAGAWQYSTDNGATWLALGTVSGTSSRLLRANDRMRFVPTGGGTSTITFRAWDQTSGSTGSLVTTATNGTTTAFSTATETASIIVTTQGTLKPITVSALSGNEGSSIPLSATVSSLTASTAYNADIDWGDGTVSNNLPFSTGTGVTSLTITSNHVYADNRTANYTVTVKLRQGTTLVASGTGTATIANVVTSIAAAKVGSNVKVQGAVLNVSTTFDLGTFTDPGFTFASAVTVESFVAQVDWGDSSAVESFTPTWTVGSAGVLTIGALGLRPHTYTTEGEKIVTIRVKDDDSTAYSSATFKVEVSKEVIFVPTDSIIQIDLSAVDSSASFNNELGFFISKDAIGTVGGLSPGAEGYAAAAINHSATHVLLPKDWVKVFKEAPAGSKPTRTYSAFIEAGSYISFFVIQDQTTAFWKANNPENSTATNVAFFATSAANPDGSSHLRSVTQPDGSIKYELEDLLVSATGYDGDFNDLVFQFKLTSLPASNPTKFFVANDGSSSNGSADEVFHYGATGMPVSTSLVNVSSNAKPIGATSNAAGDRLWILDASGSVFLYQLERERLGRYQS